LIARKLRENLSSATIRNVMVELEEAGYLAQPHTSAGRVPTDRGYRFYVDSVMDVRPLPADQVQQMERLVAPEDLDVESFLAQVCRVLASITQQAAFVVAPTVQRSTVRQIELVPLTVRRILCVLVANDEMVASHVVEIQEPMSRDEAAALGRFINTELAGLPFNQVLGSLERRLLSEHDSFYHLVKRSLSILQHALSTEPTARFFLDGTSYIVSQPEFRRDPRRAHGLLKELEAEQRLIERLEDDLGAGRVQVQIGPDIRLEGLQPCSYILAPFALGEPVVGGVGVLGPKRMDYPRLSAVVEGMSHCVEDLLRRAGAEG
jgi:heat-inducible transcriptional repressor